MTRLFVSVILTIGLLSFGCQNSFDSPAPSSVRYMVTGGQVNLSLDTADEISLFVGSRFTLTVERQTDSSTDWIAAYDPDFLKTERTVLFDQSDDQFQRVRFVFEAKRPGSTTVTIKRCNPYDCQVSVVASKEIKLTIIALTDEDPSDDNDDATADDNLPDDTTNEPEPNDETTTCYNQSLPENDDQAIVIAEGDSFTLDVFRKRGYCLNINFDQTILDFSKETLRSTERGCDLALNFTARKVGSTMLSISSCCGGCCIPKREYFVYVFEKPKPRPQQPCNCCQNECCSQADRCNRDDNTVETPVNDNAGSNETNGRRTETQDQNEETDTGFRVNTDQTQAQVDQSDDATDDQYYLDAPTPDDLVDDRKDSESKGPFGLCGSTTAANDQDISAMLLIWLFGLAILTRRRRR